MLYEAVVFTIFVFVVEASTILELESQKQLQFFCGKTLNI